MHRCNATNAPLRTARQYRPSLWPAFLTSVGASDTFSLGNVSAVYGKKAWMTVSSTPPPCGASAPLNEFVALLLGPPLVRAAYGVSRGETPIRRVLDTKKVTASDGPGEASGHPDRSKPLADR